MNAAIYCRVSTAGQQDGTSLESQEALCRKYARERGYEVHRVVHEVGSGASLAERRHLSDLRDDLRRGRYKVLLCFAVDRLSRSNIQLGVILDESERYNYTLDFASEEFAATEEGAFLQTVRSYAANLEREKIKERTIRGKRTHASNGTLSFKRRLYGYDLDARGSRVVSEEGLVVREMFDAVVSGRSLRHIANRLTKRSIASPNGSPTWYSQTVKQIINNPAYCGRTTAFRIKHKKFYREGRLVHHGYAPAPVEDHILMPDVTPPIVTVEEWEAAQIALQNNRVSRPRPGQPERLLRGLVRCGACGRLLSPKGRGRYVYYCCTSAQSPSINCQTQSFRADKYEPEVWQYVTNYIKGLTPPDPATPVEDPLAAIDRRMEQLVAEQVRIVKRSASMDDKTWKLFEAELIAKKNELDRLNLERDAIIKQAKKPSVSIEDIRTRYAETLDSLPFEGRTELLKLLGVSCTWDGNNLRVVIA